MNIGQFFIQLGIKGAKGASAAVVGLRGKMQDLENSSLTTKAAILGVMYGLERMMSASSEAGMALNQFSNFTGISAQVLQRYQYAGRQVGVTNEEVAGSFKAVQSAMANMVAGHGAPSGMEQLGRVLGQHGTGFDMNRVRDTEYVIRKLQEFAVLTKNNPDIRNMVLGSFGLGEGMISAMGRNSFNRNVMKRAPVRSDSQIQSLANVNAQWGNLHDKMSRAFDSFNIKHGPSLIKNLIEITDKMTKMFDSLTTLSEKIKLFEAIGKVFEGWAMSLDLANSALDEINKKGFMGAIKSNKDEIKTAVEMTNPSMLIAEKLTEMLKAGASHFASGMSTDIDKMKAHAGLGSGGASNNTQNNTFNIYESDDPKTTGKEIKTMINRASRQMGQGVVD